MTLAMVERWSGSERGAAMLTLPGGQPREAQLEGFQRYSAASDRWLARFLDEHLLPARRTRRLTSASGLGSAACGPPGAAPAALVVARLRPAVLPVERGPHVRRVGIVREAVPAAIRLVAQIVVRARRDRRLVRLRGPLHPPTGPA